MFGSLYHVGFRWFMFGPVMRLLLVQFHLADSWTRLFRSLGTVRKHKPPAPDRWHGRGNWQHGGPDLQNPSGVGHGPEPPGGAHGTSSPRLHATAWWRKSGSLPEQVEPTGPQAHGCTHPCGGAMSESLPTELWGPTTSSPQQRLWGTHNLWEGTTLLGPGPSQSTGYPS